jgi:polysaccharide export outer membrane protein
MRKLFYPLSLTLFFITSLSTSSCVRYPELVSFAPMNDSIPQEVIENFVDLRIVPQDLLSIKVSSYPPDAAAPFNLDQGIGNNVGFIQNTQNIGLFSGYLVDNQGNIDLPTLGKLKVAGLTTREIKETVAEKVKPYLKDPVINVRILNFKVTVSGEVNRPGTVSVANQRITVLEAIGLSGDFTNYANRANVLITREEGGVRKYARLNLQSPEVFQSPYFYLQQNDYVYVEPIKARVATVADPFSRALSFGSAALSLVTIIVTLVTR